MRNRSSVAILFMDLNMFKPINDELGHRIGDQILTGVADRLKRAVRQSDTVGRIGGDEFVVVMSDIHGSDDYHRVIDKVQRSVQVCRYLVKDFGTSQSPKSTRQRDSRYCPDRPALITTPSRTLQQSCSCATPS
ncbi:MAG: GGDEF domain-containing protein [Candidatus Sedimenticola endophacoides]